MKNIKRAISILTAVIMLLTVIPLSAFAASNTTPFTDVGSDRWYTESVNFMYEHGYMSGTSSTTFSPNTTTTRAMFVTVLGRIDGINADNYKNTSTFNDVPRNWAEPYIAWAAQQGIVNGIGGNRFNPNGFITREQAALILYNYIKDQYDVSINNTAVNNAPDKSKIDSWALTAMNWAMTNKIIAGDTDGSVRPRHSATRAELATILMRFCKYVDDLKNGTVEPTPPPIDPTPVPPCPDGKHTWVYDDPVDVDLSDVDIAVDLTEREWVFIKECRVMKCPCGLNTFQWNYDNYQKYDSLSDLAGAIRREGDARNCPWRHNPTVTHNMDTVVPALYTKHYTALNGSAKIITTHTCSKCGKTEELDWKNPEKWELHTKNVVEHEAYNEPVSVDEYYCSNYYDERFPENDYECPAMNRDVYNDADGLCDVCGKKMEYTHMNEYVYHHGDYVNNGIYNYYENKETHSQILLTTCDHNNFVRDWGDGSGFAGMRCTDCNTLIEIHYESLYK